MEHIDLESQSGICCCFWPYQYPFQLTESSETYREMQKTLEWLSHLVYIPKITLFGYSVA